MVEVLDAVVSEAAASVAVASEAVGVEDGDAVLASAALALASATGHFSDPGMAVGAMVAGLAHPGAAAS